MKGNINEGNEINTTVEFLYQSKQVGECRLMNSKQLLITLMLIKISKVFSVIS